MRVLDVKHFLVFFDFLGFFYCVSLLCCLITFSVPQQKIRGSWTLLKYVFFPSLSSLPLISSSCPYQISVIVYFYMISGGGFVIECKNYPN